jgi:hypothetical protein
MVTKYICSIDPTNKDPVHVATKFESLAIVCGYEHFMLLNIPFMHPIEEGVCVCVFFFFFACYLFFFIPQVLLVSLCRLSSVVF